MIERPLIVSPTLAATIGLHEALLLQLLTEWAQLRGEEHWQLIDKQQLQQLLPFWDLPTIEATLRQLQLQGLVELGSALNSNARNLRFALNRGSERSDMQRNTAPRKAPHSAPHSTPRTAPAPRTPDRSGRDGSASPISDHWQPDRESLTYLTRFHGIDPGFIDALIPEFIAYWREKGEARASWNSTFTQHVAKQWKKHRYEKREEAHTVPMSNDWRPSEDAVEILTRGGIDPDFIEDAIPEFILYWRENGRRDRQWNTRFVEHVRRQWAHYSNAIAFDTEPRQIPANWQPDPAVFDILKMANIDAEFARQILPEFILYWQDSRQLQRSWNSKFLQHVKYQWAHRHRMGVRHAGQQNTDGTHQSEAERLFHRLTDRSWAAGFVGKGGER